MRILFLFVAAILVSGKSTARDLDLRVFVITKNNQGSVVCALYRAAEKKSFPTKESDAFKRVVVGIVKNLAECLFRGLEIGEYAVSGFDFGYAYAKPNGLTIWEAQFGDFNNGAQIIWDQFLCATEDKWNAMNGLTVLLPHGYEGMGAEHSSGRMERFLSLCAAGNMVVANCTTPAQMFHLLRRPRLEAVL